MHVRPDLDVDADACDTCGAPGRDRELQEATLLDDSGGASLQVCDDCRAILETPRCECGRWNRFACTRERCSPDDTDRCRVCGLADPPQRRSRGIHFTDPSERAVPCCDGCRDDLLARGGGLA